MNYPAISLGWLRIDRESDPASSIRISSALSHEAFVPAIAFSPAQRMGAKMLASGLMSLNTMTNPSSPILLECASHAVMSCMELKQEEHVQILGVSSKGSSFALK